MSQTSHAALPAGIRDAIAGLAGGGDPLPVMARERLERATGARLSDVRVHTSASADRIASALGADAITAGADVFFRAGRYEPGSARGLFLLGHEVGHALDAPRGTGVGCDPAAEARADTVGVAAVRGTRAIAGARPPERITAAAPFVLSRHASWEHRLLGDAPSVDLDDVAKRGARRQAILEGLRDFLYMWYSDPDSVTAPMIQARYPTIRTLTLTGSQLLVTYGELNTLPDYLASPTAIDAMPRDVLLPILQSVRQEGYNRVQLLLGGWRTSFAGAAASNWNWGMLDLLLETNAIDALTVGLGPSGSDHYTGLVARNACHFAPYAWYRWETFYTVARAEALASYNSTDPATKQRLAHQAWINHGYADHFLQDSFAAGHLVNKTLVMQWFVEWTDGRWYVSVPDWNGCVETMTSARQPLLWAPDLYTPAAPGTTRDPQTADEQATLQERMDMCGVRADGPSTQQVGYRNYLAFLNSTIVQASSGALHDYFNANSVWVSSVADPTPFQLWGDDTMLNGGDGVRIASETAHLSQQSIQDLLTTGATATTVQSLRDRFPTSVSSTGPDDLASLHDWNVGLRDFALGRFPWMGAKFPVVAALHPRIGNVSQDQGAFPPPARASAAKPVKFVPSTARAKR